MCRYQGIAGKTAVAAIFSAIPSRPAFFPAFVLLLTISCGPAPTLAQTEENGKLRQRAEEILSDPEFRHLIRNKRGSSLNPGMESEGESDSEGKSGKSRKGDKGQSTRKTQDSTSRRKRSRNEADKSSKSSDADSGASLPNFGGALGSLLGPLVHGMAWLIIAAIVGMIAWLVYTAVKNYQRADKLETTSTGNVLDQVPDKAPGDTDADVYVARGRELAAQGRYREAVAQLLLGAMSRIERAGLIRFRRGLTHRDYLRAVRRKETPHRSMDAMVGLYEPLGFGRREATQDHFDRTLEEYQAGFRETSLVDA